jgi:hypothetical protein
VPFPVYAIGVRSFTHYIHGRLRLSEANGLKKGSKRGACVEKKRMDRRRFSDGRSLRKPVRDGGRRA